jgi:hypothetical protein
MITMTRNHPLWRKSSYSNGQANCVETASRLGTVAVRDSKDPSGAQLAIPATTWRAFTRRVQDC